MFKMNLVEKNFERDPMTKTYAKQNGIVTVF